MVLAHSNGYDFHNRLVTLQTDVNQVYGKLISAQNAHPSKALKVYPVVYEALVEISGAFARFKIERPSIIKFYPRSEQVAPHGHDSEKIATICQTLQGARSVIEALKPKGVASRFYLATHFFTNCLLGSIPKYLQAPTCHVSPGGSRKPPILEKLEQAGLVAHKIHSELLSRSVFREFAGDRYNTPTYEILGYSATENFRKDSNGRLELRGLPRHLHILQCLNFDHVQDCFDVHKGLTDMARVLTWITARGSDPNSPYLHPTIAPIKFLATFANPVLSQSFQVPEGLTVNAEPAAKIVVRWATDSRILFLDDLYSGRYFT
jgi:hypothetical protein